LLPNDNKENENKALNEETDECEKGVLSRGSTSRLTVEEALDLAFSYFDSGHLLKAEQVCRLILQKVPNQVDAMQLLGVLLVRRNQYAESVQLLYEAIQQAPECAHLHNSLGIALHKLEKPEEAVSEFNRALEIRPDFAKAHNNLGVTLMKLGRIDKAINAYREAIRLQCNFKEAYNNLGLALKKTGELEKAVESYEKAVSVDSEYAEALSNLGLAQIVQGKLAQADVNLKKAVSLVPDSPELLNNLGVLYNRQEHFEEAVTVCEEAIAIRQNNVEAYNNLGTALMEVSRFPEADAAFKRAITIDPECAGAHHNRALVLLLTGQFEEGWQEYEWRWKSEGFSTPLRPFTQEWWNGSVEGVSKLLVWAEQGIGDEVQFSGLIRNILSRGIQVVVECDKRLVPLLQRSFPGIIVVARTNSPALLLKDPSVTHQIQMGSIPRILGLFPDSMPFQKPFMVFDEGRRNQFRSEYKGDGNPVLVGISFRSGNSQEGLKRSIGLDQWGPILKVSGTRFVNLQYGECSGQLQAAYGRFGVKILEDKRINSLKDLESFAAQVAAMDLVISVDNSTVHFAGALGVEVWTMLPNVPDWRWGLEGERTRWYSTMRLFRQQERGKWEPVISKVAEELASLVSRTK
jgi:Flp pilus assembly protein TadD